MIQILHNSLESADRIVIIKDDKIVFDGDLSLMMLILVTIVDQLTNTDAILFRLSDRGVESFLEVL